MRDAPCDTHCVPPLSEATDLKRQFSSTSLAAGRARQWTVAHVIKLGAAVCCLLAGMHELKERQIQLLLCEKDLSVMDAHLFADIV